MPYQDFDGKGDSRSHAKLEALRLDDFANVAKRDRERPLSGLSVLDIGCNEGFFCIEAVNQGAARVVGVDVNAKFIESARARCPAATFLQATWWQLPNEKFDVIFFLSAIHYEKQQKALLERLRASLKADGVLVLECGVLRDQPGRRWYTVKRADGARRYPTENLLVQDLLAGYSVRRVGPSVRQGGDPIDRHVYHCRLRASTALLLAATGGTGKSTLAAALEQRGIPVYDTDTMFERVLFDKHYAWSPLQGILRDAFAGTSPPSWGKIGIFVAQNNHGDLLADIIVGECAAEADVFCVEGDVLRHSAIRDSVIGRLTQMNIRSWVIAKT